MYRNPLDHTMISSVLRLLEHNIKKAHGGKRPGGPLKVIMTGPASAVLAQGPTSTNVSIGEIRIDAANRDESQELEAALELVYEKIEKMPHVTVFRVSQLSYFDEDLKVLYSEASVNDHNSIYPGRGGLEVYAADWDFQVAMQMHRAAYHGHYNETVADYKRDEHLLQAMVVVRHVVDLLERYEKPPLALPGPDDRLRKYRVEWMLTVGGVRYMQHAYSVLYETIPPFYACSRVCT